MLTNLLHLQTSMNAKLKPVAILTRPRAITCMETMSVSAWKDTLGRIPCLATAVAKVVIIIIITVTILIYITLQHITIFF